MTKYKCDACDTITDFPDVHKTTYGDWFGADDPKRTPLEIPKCPFCGELESLYELDDFDEMW